MIINGTDPKGIEKIQELDNLGFKFTELILYNAYEWEYTAVICEQFQGIYKLIDIAKKHNIKF
jgi:hypothetical protein